MKVLELKTVLAGVDGLIAFGGRLSGRPPALAAGLMESRLHIAYKRNACTGTQLEERS